MKATLRAFVALKLPEEIIDSAAGLQNELRSCGLKLRWVKPQNLHLTLKFLGDIPKADATEVGETMGHTVADEPPLEMILQGMGVFPGIKRPRVLWLGFGGQFERLKRLQLKLEACLESIGLPRDRRAFKAHLTIARFKGKVAIAPLVEALKTVGSFPPQPFTARKMVLYKSDLHPQGAVYTPLADADLTSSSDGLN